MPIGPAPVISTSSPSTGKLSAVWTALPKGSKMAATSRSMPGVMLPDVGHRQGDVFGERAVAVDADALRMRAEVAPARHAVAAAPADQMPLAADEIAGMKVVDVSADLDDLADELVPDHQRDRDGALRPGVPVVDVEIGAADTGAQDTDEQVVDADRPAPGHP